MAAFDGFLKIRMYYTGLVASAQLSQTWDSKHPVLVHQISNNINFFTKHFLKILEIQTNRLNTSIFSYNGGREEKTYF